MQVVLDTWSTFWTALVPYLSKLIVALIVLVIGIILAKVLEKLIVQVLKVARFDILSEKSSIASILAKGEIKHSLSELLGIVIYWLLILVVAIITLTIAGLPPTGYLDNAVAYAGKVVLSIFVLVLGLFFAALIGSIVRTTASNAGMATAKNLGQIAQVVIIVITALTVLPMLGVRTFILDTAVIVVLASAGLALGLAFGLGSKDIAGKIMSELVDKWKKR
ncbi:MAG: hypothetical protein A2879_01210 [Omnitrophica WOR_2 bacterium RIFCSPHIGHO2_01_FULL_49_10]|nr:MAG: hypothetical protein A2879_01210 [Omnitrophica WOR_2 bacterium RIFCSPHIGHO2_01_FULL_49_10]OGX34636.1 MAG: hypothetical protein A3I43_02585 [Omnitrophica WOR_2 bacterium RIFCSPLOWO2_02_FULL_50_19]